jgi:uncharacterized protein YukE
MALTGMDIAEVQRLAAQLHTAASDLRTMANNLTTALGNTTWIGPDRQRFESDWQSIHASQISHVADALDQASNNAHQNAQQQTDASQ